MNPCGQSELVTDRPVQPGSMYPEVGMIHIGRCGQQPGAQHR